MEELTKPMEVIHERMKTIPGNNSNASTPCYACQDKPNFVKALVSKTNKLIMNSISRSLNIVVAILTKNKDQKQFFCQ